MSETDQTMSDDDKARRRTRQISDAQTMRALAHPVRLELLDLIRREGDMTATRAAEVLDESPGNMSWHLQTLAKYGFVEESGEGKGRSRPWRLAAESNRFVADDDDPVSAAAGSLLARQVLDRAVAGQHQWLTESGAYPAEWRESAFLTDSLGYLTPGEIAQMSEEVREIFARYDARDARGERPAAALPVRLTAFGHPLPLTQSGN